MPVWDQRKGEPGPAYEAFLVYRDLGPGRTIVKAAEIYAKKINEENSVDEYRKKLPKWSGQYDWFNRVTSWDSELDRFAFADRVEKIREMNQRHVNESHLLQQKALDALTRVQPEDLTPKDILAFLSSAINIERDALGVNNLDQNLPPVKISEQDIGESTMTAEQAETMAKAIQVLAYYSNHDSVNKSIEVSDKT